MEPYDNFIKQFEVWGRAQKDIRAAFIIGSVGGKAQVAWSDVDIAFVTQTPEQYRNPQKWLLALGTVWTGVYDSDDSISGLPTSASLFAVMDEGIYVDFSILPYWKTRLWSWFISTPFTQRTLFAREARETAYLFRKGIEVLFDHDGFIHRLERNLQSMVFKLQTPVSSTDIHELWNEFHLGVLHMVRYLMKEQPFAAQIVRDRAVRRCLLTLTQWHAQARDNDWNDPLRYRDRQIEKWSHPEFSMAMPHLFGGYSAELLWQSLLESLRIFLLLSNELAATCGFSRNDGNSKSIETWINAQYQHWRKNHTPTPNNIA